MAGRDGATCEDVSSGKAVGMSGMGDISWQFSPRVLYRQAEVLRTELMDWNRRRFEGPRRDPTLARVPTGSLSALGAAQLGTLQRVGKSERSVSTLHIGLSSGSVTFHL